MTRHPSGQRRMFYAREQAALKKIEDQAENADRQFQLCSINALGCAALRLVSHGSWLSNSV